MLFRQLCRREVYRVHWLLGEELRLGQVSLVPTFILFILRKLLPRFIFDKKKTSSIN